MDIFNWFKNDNMAEKKKADEKSIEERWKPTPDDDCGWIPIRPQKQFDPVRDAKPDTTPKVQPVIRKEKVFEGPSASIWTERGGEYIDWSFPTVVPNVILDKTYTREQLAEICFIHQTHCLKQEPLAHPEFEPSDIASAKEQIKKWFDLTESLFLETDQKHFDHILLNLQRKLPGLKLEWKRGRLWVNDAKTTIRCLNIDKAYKVLREIGGVDDIEEFLVDLIGNQLGEIFVT